MRNSPLDLRRWIIELAIFAASVSPTFAQEPSSTLRSESTVVLVPTLVRTKAGEITYGLQAKDFIIEDNGIEQEVTLDDSPEREPVSLIVALQIGGKASRQFKKKPDLSLYDTFYSEEERKDCRLRKRPCPTAVGGLGSLLEEFLNATKGEIALVTFDSMVYRFQDFTQDPSVLSDRLTKLTPGDGGAAILDAVRYSLQLLDARPKANRRILFLISETRDHGSKTITASDFVQQLAVSNTLISSLTFSPMRSEFAEGLKSIPTDDQHFNLLAPLEAAVGGLRKNVAAGVTEVMGGDSRNFKDKTTFDAAFASVVNDIRASYLLSFQPKQPKPGPHQIRVRLRNPDKDLVLKSRAEYWAVKH